MSTRFKLVKSGKIRFTDRTNQTKIGRSKIQVDQQGYPQIEVRSVCVLDYYTLIERSEVRV